ncbi:SDR family NAD(P)-dependent oxidoreductase [bacterium]|nr:SDR family NAD(P)-dependent oxidoreductase [bacterium]
MNELNGQWILITGASKGLGREMALLFAEAGANLILTARSAELLDTLYAQVAAHGIACVTIPGDLRDPAVLDAVKETCEETDVDILVNNAGIVDITPLDGVTDARIDELIELNLIVPIKLTRAVIGMFKARKRGVIVSVNSAGGKKPVPDHAIYCASKYGLNGFTEAVKLEIKGLGIRILNVCPGKMATELFAAAGRDMDTSAFLSPREVAEGVLYMLTMSETCSHAELSVDRKS